MEWAVLRNAKAEAEAMTEVWVDRQRSRRGVQGRSRVGEDCLKLVYLGREGGGGDQQNKREKKKSGRVG